MATWWKRQKIGTMTLTTRSDGFARSYRNPMAPMTKVYDSLGKVYTVRTQHAAGWTRRTRSKY